MRVCVSGHALEGEQGGNPGFLHGGTDSTERKRAEELLRKQSAAMTASMDGIAILDEGFRFTYLNDALAKLYGYPSQLAMLGIPLNDLYEIEEIERFAREVLPVVREEGRWRGEAN